jgi:tellurite resistance protein TerC
MPLRKALYWTFFWIAASLALNALIWLLYGGHDAMLFLTGYVIEKALSVDNLFVFLIIFRYFGITLHQQRRVLNYGIIGVVLLRGVLILLGTTLVQQFHWILYVFGGVLVYSAWRIVFGHDAVFDPGKSTVLRWARSVLPVTEDTGDAHFVVRRGKGWAVTPLLLVLIVIETTDVVFAVDSIPAIFAITTNAFLVLSSNLMAVLGLRSLFFVLEHTERSFAYVKYGVGLVLVFIGFKMLLMDLVYISTWVSLLIVTALLVGSMLVSLLSRAQSPSNTPPPPAS